jgi:hypothetical protein
MSYTIDISPSPIPPLHPSIGSFLSDFYRVSDSPDAHDDYVNFFTQDASFVMASKQARGHDGTFSTDAPSRLLASVPISHTTSAP